MRNSDTKIVYTGGDARDSVVATLTISMPISGWRGLAKEAVVALGKENDWKAGNYYACQWAWAIKEILATGEKKFIEFHDETVEARERFSRVAAELDSGGQRED